MGTCKSTLWLETNFKKFFVETIPAIHTPSGNNGFYGAN